MATYTTRLGLYKPAADGSENVNVVSDLNDNWDRLDAMVSFVPVTTGTYPASAYRGESFYETDTGKGYINTSAVASSISKAQVLVAGADFDSNITLSSSAGQIKVGGTGSDSTFAAQRASASDFLMSGRITGASANSAFTVTVGGTMGWGAGGASATDTNLYRSSANVLATDDSLSVGGSLTVTASANLDDALIGGNLIIGSATYRNRLSTVTTVANTVTETALATMTIPANDMVAGAVFRMRVVGVASVTGTPTMTFRARIGGTGGTQLTTSGTITFSSGVQNKPWGVEFYMTCVTTGASGTLRAWGQTTENFATTGNGATISGATSRMDVSTSAITSDTTIARDLVVTATWGTASASNTLTSYVAIIERVA